ncbi:MAG: EAL domain-containing protein [Thiolinea sp.]
MSQHIISCTIINRNQSMGRLLEAELRKVDFNVSLQYANNWQELETRLAESPALVFCADDFQPQQENRVLEILQQRSPDSVLVKLSARRWEAIATRLLGVEVCTISSGDNDYLQQQLDYLLNYASLKTRFRQCKHLLSVAELRCQWLVDYAREPVAFVSEGRHLHANVAYLSLFGIHSEAEALTIPLLSLVKKDERAIFSTLSASAERGTRPSNRLLMTLCRSNRRPFRAEIRFIPSVFRGQRCVQLHVHPLKVIAEQEPALQHNPWEKKAARNGASSSSRIPARQPVKPEMNMHAAFEETLNLRVSTQAGLMIAEPYLQYATGRRVPWSRLQADADKSNSRARLDWWNLRNALLHPQVQSRNARLRVLVTLGAWIFTQAPLLKDLLRVLHKNQRIAQRLILGIRLEDYAAHAGLARQILSALRATGVHLAFDHVLQADPSLIQQAKATGVGLVRLHPGHASRLAKRDSVPQQLSELIQTFDNEGINVVVTGVQDLASMNLLCVTQASYLQGDILGKFSR